MTPTLPFFPASKPAIRQIMEYLEGAVFLPALRAEFNDFPGQRTELAAIQCQLIAMLRRYHACNTTAEVFAAYVEDLNSSETRNLCRQLKSLGFDDMADEAILTGFLNLAYRDERAAA